MTATLDGVTNKRITDKVIEEMSDWCNRPLDEVYAAKQVEPAQSVPSVQSAQSAQSVQSAPAQSAL